MNRLIGVIHLAPLPGSPGFRGEFAAGLESAATDARLLADAGFDALIIENFGTALKIDGVTTNPVDPARAASFVKAAG